MKKIITGLCLLSTLALSSEHFKVTNTYQSIGIKIGSANLNNDMFNEKGNKGMLEVFLQKNSFFSNKFVVGSDLSIGYNERQLEATSLIKAGYNFGKAGKGFSLFGNISPIIQVRQLNNSSKNSDTTYGIGVGSVLEYVTEDEYNYSLSATQYRMKDEQNNNNGYDYTKILFSIGVKI